MRAATRPSDEARGGRSIAVAPRRRARDTRAAEDPSGPLAGAGPAASDSDALCSGRPGRPARASKTMAGGGVAWRVQGRTRPAAGRDHGLSLPLLVSPHSEPAVNGHDPLRAGAGRPSGAPQHPAPAAEGRGIGQLGGVLKQHDEQGGVGGGGAGALQPSIKEHRVSMQVTVASRLQLLRGKTA